VTAIRDRQSDPDADEIPVPWDELPIVGTKRGLPWWGAVLLGFGLAILGAFVDLKLQGRLTLLFQAFYCGGAILAVGWVQRQGLFGPMVQPPLVLAVTVPGVVFFASGAPGGTDTLGTLLKVGQPLIDGFPMMAIATGATVLIGFFRIYRERDPNRLVKIKSNKKPSSDKAAPKRPVDERPSAGDGSRTGRQRLPADGQPPPRRRPPAESGTQGAPARRTRPAPEDGERRPRGDRDPAAPRRRPEDPDARRPRQPRPRDEEGNPPRRRPEPREGEPRARRAPRPDEPRRSGEGPRRAPGGRRGETPPPRSRPWDET
jgi:hypothetical protein